MEILETTTAMETPETTETQMATAMAMEMLQQHHKQLLLQKQLMLAHLSPD
jgi:hypothetical protein